MFKIPEPELQVGFARELVHIRKAMLQDSLRKTLRSLDIPTIDKQLAEIVPAHSLATLAGYGLRGELIFPVPEVLSANPRLLGYYRLLYGFSQKAFYKSGVGGQFRALEENGALTNRNRDSLLDFCRAMAEAGTLLLAGINAGKVSAAVLDDLTLLTLGPQWRGGTNVKIGIAGIAAVFGVMKEIVSAATVTANQARIQLKNAAGRTVLIEFAADPDIIIREELGSGKFRHVVAVEVKGGTDFSNVHNRIGEAEKSHQKARLNKYTECWTVVNVDKIDMKMAERESPSTDRFYRLSDLIRATGSDFYDFRDRVLALTGTPS
jgi:hypothetical protein